MSAVLNIGSLSEEEKKRIEIAYEKSIDASYQLKELEQLVYSMEQLMGLKGLNDSMGDHVKAVKEKLKSARSSHAFTQMHVQGVHWGQL